MWTTKVQHVEDCRLVYWILPKWDSEDLLLLSFDMVNFEMWTAEAVVPEMGRS